MTQLNTPYPATAYLTGFLRARGIDAVQADPAIELLLRLLSAPGLIDIAAELERTFPKDSAGNRVRAPLSVRHFLRERDRYVQTIDGIIRFLQGKDSTLAHRIAGDGFLPRGPRFDSLKQLDLSAGGDGLHQAFGSLGLTDRAQHLASLYIDDLADVIRDGIDPRFELARYGERLAASAPSFDPLRDALEGPPTLVDRYLDQIADALIAKHQPRAVGLTIPFPGNVYGAFRIARTIRRVAPQTTILAGGGYVNTELRELQDARVFDYVDYLTLDDGEAPVLHLLQSLEKPVAEKVFLRTLLRENGAVVQKSTPQVHDIPMKDCGVPTYDGLPLDKYLSLCELLNPMHRLWSDGRWNKLTLAHGCYWKKCTFCDISLDYIGRYEDQGADLIVDRMEKLIAETGQTGFHFVDEAAPPKTLAAMAQKIIDRGLSVTWWGNIRFEKSFTPELTKLLARSGCVAISGGLEVASDRLLHLMEKGVTVEQVANVTQSFAQAGIMVHAYLMYGFPTETLQETIDSLERVRQLFEAGCIHSGFWHRFACTIHSPIGKNPAKYGITLQPVESTFARNDVDFTDAVGTDHDALTPGLRKALYNYMHGMGLKDDVRGWFENVKVPATTVPRDLVGRALFASLPVPPRQAERKQSRNQTLPKGSKPRPGLSRR